MTGHFGRQAIRRAAVILEIADRYSANELDDALAAARGAVVYSFEQAGADVDAERALVEALDAAVAILQNRRVAPPLRRSHSRSAATAFYPTSVGRRGIC
jgi:mannose/cellobiose epimerase-like protein (N-acyl-D-glucosamine 2-epimerase family)